MKYDLATLYEIVSNGANALLGQTFGDTFVGCLWPPINFIDTTFVIYFTGIRSISDNLNELRYRWNDEAHEILWKKFLAKHPEYS